MRKLLLNLLVLSVVFIGKSNAQTTDQSHTGSISYNSSIIEGWTPGQSFTAGISGSLNKVSIDLTISTCSEPLSSFSMTVDIIDGDGFGGAILSTEHVTIPIPYSRNMFPITFSSPTSVISGQVYTIRTTADANQICDDDGFGDIYMASASWYTSDGDTYSNGVPYNYGNGTLYTGGVDYYFETKVVELVCITDQLVSAAQSTFDCEGSTTINIASSEIGVDYYLRDDAEDSIIDGPIAGTGSTLSLNTGTISASTTYNVYGSTTSYGLDFDGVDDYIEVSNVLTADNESQTIECWVKIPSLPTDNGRIVQRGQDGFGAGWSLGLTVLPTGNVKFGSCCTNGGVVNSTTSLVPNNWYHIAGVYTNGASGSVELFINGVSEGVMPLSNPALRSSTKSFLFGKGNIASEQFNGAIDGIRIWNDARTPVEISTNYNTFLTGNEANLVGYYKFDTGSGSTLTDTVGSNDGALTNMDPANDWVTGQGACSLEMAVTPTVTINSIIDQGVSPAQSSFMCTGSTIIDVASSETGVNYYLRDAADDSVIAGPIVGTGGAISFNTGDVAISTTYNVYAEVIDSSGALFFEEDPTNKYVQLATDPMSGTTSLTVEMWIKPDINAGSNIGYVPLFGHDSGANRGFISSDGSIAWKADNGATFLGSEPGGFTFDGNWHHLAIVYDETLLSGSRNIIYLDGISLALNLNNDFGGWNAPVPLRIGNSWFSQDYNYDGEMDEFRVWGVARSQAEIQSNMDAVSPSSAGLLAYYNFEDGTGSSTLSDISGNGHTGTLVNHDVNADWTTKTSVNCALEMTQTATVTISQITDQTVTAATSSFMCAGSTTIDVASSETGVNYYLRDDADNSIIAGPLAGTGSAISFNTGTISSTTTYNVYAEKLGPLGTPSVYDFNTSVLPVELITTGSKTWGAAQAGTGALSGEQVLVLQGATADAHRSYLKTIATDFISKEFSIEVLHNQNGSGGNSIFFFGIGDPGAGGSEPTNGIYTRFHPSGLEGADMLANSSTSPSLFESLFNLIGQGNGLSRIKMEKTGDILQFFIDVNNTGTYVQYGIDIDVSTANFDYLNATNSSIFIGTGSSLSQFDDLTISSSVVTCSLEMTVTPTVSITAVDASTNRVDDVITANNVAATSYQWVDCNNANAPIPSEISQSFTATAIGSYAVEVTQNGCTVTSACVNIATLGISDDVFGAGIKLYPNPTTGCFTLSFKKNTGETTVTIFDIIGKEVYASRKVNNQSLQLDINHFSNGVYFVRIQNNESQKVIRLIKQ